MSEYLHAREFTDVIMDAANRLREQGNYEAALHLIYDGMVWYESAHLADESLEFQTLYLVGLRIIFGCSLSIASRHLLKESLNDDIELVHSVVLMYLRPEVQKIARELKQDTHGNLYYFWNEMQRDLWNYMRYLSRVCRQEEQHLKILIMGVELSTTFNDPGAASLLRYEADAAAAWGTGSISQHFDDKYGSCIYIARKRLQWERVATVSAWHVIITVHEAVVPVRRRLHLMFLKSTLRALRDWRDAYRHDKSTFWILPRQCLRHVFEAIAWYRYSKRRVKVNWNKYKIDLSVN